MHFGGSSDDDGLAQYAFFMEMDDGDAGAAGSSELAHVRDRSEIDNRDLEADASCQPASVVTRPRCVNDGTCPYLLTAAQLQSIIKSDRAQVSSMDCSQQSTVQDKVAPRGPCSRDASHRSEDDEIAWAKSALLDCKHLKRVASTEYCIKNAPMASSLELMHSFEGDCSKEPTGVSEREQELALVRALARQRASGVLFSLSGERLFLGTPRRP